ncbi:MAG: hypothetical protein ACE5EX_08825, partial [Phycisphaerae bacterium]
MNESLFPQGTPVRVTQTIRRRDRDYRIEVVGTVEAWDTAPTGSWYAKGKPAWSGDEGPRLWLNRLVLRKVDGELTSLVVDDATQIARLDAAV